ncbi:MAG TPA: hypothetical protein VHA75_13410 [Rugosimonospora sp.]|nr:hypothetical protein [Rugosimonospora sp.]
MTQPTPTPEDPAEGINPHSDQSLHSWGRSLGRYPAAIEQVHTASKQRTSHVAAMAAKMKQLAQVAETEMPADRRLASTIGDTASAMSTLAAEYEALDRRLATLHESAAGLPGMYRAQHEADEERLNNPRNGLDSEQRADVGRARQDT